MRDKRLYGWLVGVAGTIEMAILLFIVLFSHYTTIKMYQFELGLLFFFSAACLLFWCYSMDFFKDEVPI